MPMASLTTMHPRASARHWHVCINCNSVNERSTTSTMETDEDEEEEDKYCLIAIE